MREMKYSEGVYALGKKESENIAHKVSEFRKVTKTKCAIHPILITTIGLKDNMYSDTVQEVVTLEDLLL